MNPEEFPLVLSPNLGCPKILELEQGKISVPLIVAGKYGASTAPTWKAFENLFRLVPSYDGEGKEIDLLVSDDPVELRDWNKLFDFSNLEDTQTLISSELHYNVLGEGTTYWKVNACFDAVDPNELLRVREVEGGERRLPTLYDLVMFHECGKNKRTNYHCVQFVEKIRNGDLNFIHLADAHVAKRNDEILDEVMKVNNDRSEQEIRSSYINFNQNFRTTISLANDMADRGELDFVLLTGDLVDQSFHGWEDAVNQDENNFKEFVDVVVGRGNEPTARQNPGLKVALYTTTGNHDWRMHPYDPSVGRSSTFGLKACEAKHYPYRSFDLSEHQEDARARLAKQLSSEGLKKLNLASFNKVDKWKMRLGKLSGKIYSSNLISNILGRLVPGLTGLHFLYIFQDDFRLTELSDWRNTLPYIATLISIGVRYVAGHLANKVAALLVDNPLRAEAKALHYYFVHVNPYLDYAFSYGKNHFILMDTGRDAFAGNLLDSKEVRHLKRVSVTDNFIGGAPDSRAFDSEQLYYNWSQIVWFEKALTAKAIGENDNVFVGMHTPAVNVPDILYEKLPWWRKGYRQFQKIVLREATIYDQVNSWSDIWESNKVKKNRHSWIAKNEIDLSYGTLNHYVSQFFFLCLGLSEEGHRRRPLTQPLKKRVAMVLSGHAHRNIEFSLWLDWDQEKKEHEVRIFSDLYSDPSPELGEEWKNRPLLIQTAACGLQGEEDKNPPYFRKIQLQNGRIHFKVGTSRLMNS